ncbi:heme oxygenase-like, multi-helical [Metarhizium rileyi]|uniref:Heme oxygenase-like, multi-helical n=1 Tax=Metarhizium rileyi (strain RCEF 4871) TaxID=1649241 RepID=A0A166WE70_METRR|nr:heme oxygenase-like, multi-helical [Metarhizium rileyi RCEF 4871]
MNLSNALVILHHHFVLSLAVLVPAIIYCLGLSKRKTFIASISKIQAVTPKELKRSQPNPANTKPTQWYRNTFFQLQHLEDHPEVLQAARDELLAMFSRGLAIALKRPKDTILRIEQYNADHVWKFLEDMRENVLEKWTDYLQRRTKGQGPELFGTVEAAKAWLVQQAPVKFVDGAWLGHVHKITTPFALRGVTRDAWQVLSEEFGDGDLSKHHVHLYRKLLKDVGCPLPEGHTLDFINLAYWDEMDNHNTWEAAVSQLLISMFPNEFLPEILGFNMHFEMVTLDTMQAAHELKDLHIDPYYFLIHITIDNAHSGHTAMATHAVTRYLDLVRSTDGEAAAQQAWRRVQVGYILSQSLGSRPHEQEIPEASTVRTDIPGHMSPNLTAVLPDTLSAQMIDIFRSKASVSQQFHCQSRARIGAHTISGWLDPGKWKHPKSQPQLELLAALSQAKPWVVPGDSKKSLLVRELSWGGRMFGAFTRNEVATLCSWIDALRTEIGARTYWSFTNMKPISSEDAIAELQSPVCHHPLSLTCSSIDAIEMASRETGFDRAAWVAQQSLNCPSIARLPDIIPLWFSHIGLLENTINAPSRTACPLHASILRLLRAQAGFEIETDIVAGMDELRRKSRISLVDIGLELIQQTIQTTGAKPTSLRDVFILAANQGQGDESARLADDMLRWSARPVANLGLLLGLALAFLELKYAVGRAPDLLGKESRFALEAIVARERISLEDCARELKRTDMAQYGNLERGLQLGVSALQKCF